MSLVGADVDEHSDGSAGVGAAQSYLPTLHAAAASPPARPAPCTSATRARRCSPGWPRAVARRPGRAAHRGSGPRARGRRAPRQRLLDELRLLGLDWDEGPDAAAPRPLPPERARPHYDAAIEQLLGRRAGLPVRLLARRRRPRRQRPPRRGRRPPLSGHLPPASTRDGVRARAAAAGRAAAVRFRGDGAPLATSTTWCRGACDPLGPAGLDDFVIRRADGMRRLPAGGGGRRRGDGDDRRGAWRRPAVLDAPAAGAVRARWVHAPPASPMCRWCCRRPASGWPSGPDRRRSPTCARRPIAGDNRRRARRVGRPRSGRRPPRPGDLLAGLPSAAISRQAAVILASDGNSPET